MVDLILACVALGALLAYATIGVAVCKVAVRSMGNRLNRAAWGWGLTAGVTAVWGLGISYALVTTTGTGNPGPTGPGLSLETALFFAVGLPLLFVSWMAIGWSCEKKADIALAVGILWPLALLDIVTLRVMRVLIAGPHKWGTFLSEVPLRIEDRSANKRRNEERSLADRKKELDERDARIARKEVEAGLEPLSVWKDG